MYYPADMTAEDIMEFEFDINRLIDIDRNEGQFWAVNAELQVIADNLKEQMAEVQADFLFLGV